MTDDLKKNTINSQENQLSKNNSNIEEKKDENFKKTSDFSKKDSRHSKSPARSKEKTKHKERGIINTKQKDSQIIPKKVSLVEPAVEEDLNQLKKEDLIVRIKESRERFKMFQEEKQKIIENKSKELELKEQSINNIAKTNQKLIEAIEELKKEVDERLDKVIVKKSNSKNQKVTEQEKENQQNSFDQALKNKEKELKNATKLIEVLKKDKESLFANLNERSDFKQVIDYEDKLKAAEMKSKELTLEVETLKKMTKEHTKCIEIRTKFENEKKLIKEDIHKLKEKNRETFAKLKEEEFTHQKTKDSLVTIKRDYEIMKKDNEKMKQYEGVSLQPVEIEKNKETNQNQGNKNNEKTKLENSNKEGAQSYTPAYIYADPFIPRNSNRSKSPEFENKKKLKIKSESNQAKYFSKPLELLRNNMKQEQEKDIPKLFEKEERKNLEKLLTKEEIDTFENRYEATIHSRIVTERKLNTEKKSITNQINELEEQLKYLNLNFKESEQKAKMLSFQINDFKEETSQQENQLYECNMTVNILNQLLKEKEQENKILLSQIHNLKKTTKHNSLAPIVKKVPNENNEKKQNNTEFEDEEREESDSDDQNYKIRPQKNKGLDS